MSKNYLLQVLERCSDQAFGQDAIEWAIVAGHVTLTGDLDCDLHAILGVGADNYDRICASYREHCRQQTALLVESYTPLLEELNRPIPLAA